MEVKGLACTGLAELILRELSSEHFVLNGSFIVHEHAFIHKHTQAEFICSKMEATCLPLKGSCLFCLSKLIAFE